jgi:exopolysaccharide biosynthesis polyprenyl glycosylphosphotransferase
MLRQFSTRRVIGFFLLDWLGTIALMGFADRLRANWETLPNWILELMGAFRIPIGGVEGLDTEFKFLLLIFVAMIWPFFLIVFSVYDGRRNETLKIELLNVFLAVNVSMLVLAGGLYFTYRGTSRLTLALFWQADLLLLLGSRVLWWVYRRTHNGRRAVRLRSVLVVGAGEVGCNVVEQLHRFAWADFLLRGFIDDDPEKQGKVFGGIPVLGSLDQAIEIVQRYQIRDAVVTLPMRAHDRLVEICHSLQDAGVHVHVVPDLFALSFPNAALDGFGGIPVIDLGQPGINGPRRVIKKSFDILAASLGVVILSPLLLLIAILIKLESPGPVIYKQTRIGENGKLFTMLKFRSMRINSDTGIHQAYVTRLICENLNPEQLAQETGQKSLKMESDPRITRVGWFIRKTSLDELPQLFNVIRGEMSLVGPRPSLPYEVELYQHWHRRRFEAPPGITGLWQVEGRNRVSFDEMVRMDIEYIERQSFWMDLILILKTPLAVLSAKGAG